MCKVLIVLVRHDDASVETSFQGQLENGLHQLAFHVRPHLGRGP